VFGVERAISVPYGPVFRRSLVCYSHLYWGCLLEAIEELGRRKGYALVGSNSVGINAYFVRRKQLGEIREMNAREAYVESKVQGVKR